MRKVVFQSTAHGDKPIVKVYNPPTDIRIVGIGKKGLFKTKDNHYYFFISDRFGSIVPLTPKEVFEWLKENWLDFEKPEQLKIARYFDFDSLNLD